MHGDTEARDAPGAGGARVVWGGHATVRIDMDGVRLLTDPLLVGRIGHLRRVVPVPPGLTEDVDAVLVSHVHRDHLDLPTLRRIAPEVPVIAPAGARRVVARADCPTIVELVPGQETTVGDVRVRATPAAHRGGRMGAGGAGLAVGFVLEGTAAVYFAGDTDLFPEMEALADPLDLALLPVGGWSPHLGPGHLDAMRAAEALARCGARIGVPIHWGTYAPLGVPRGARYLHDPGPDLRRIAASVAPDAEVRVLAPGVPLHLPPRATAPPGAG